MLYWVQNWSRIENRLCSSREILSQKSEIFKKWRFFSKKHSEFWINLILNRYLRFWSLLKDKLFSALLYLKFWTLISLYFSLLLVVFKIMFRGMSNIVSNDEKSTPCTTMMSSHFYKFEQNKFNRAFFYDKMLIQNVQEILLQINHRKNWTLNLPSSKLRPPYFVHPFFTI